MKIVKRPLVLDAGGPGSMAVIQNIKQTLPNVVVTACDMDKYAPASLIADNFIQVLPADHPEYATNIKNIIEEYKIDLVVPSFHFGHQILASLKSSAFINNFEASILCQDKLKFYEWCVEHGFKVPHTQLLSSTEKIQSKAYIKPRFGAGSANNYVAATNDDFLSIKSLLRGEQDYLVQEFIEGKLWLVDALQLDGSMIASPTCQSIRVKAGNTTTALVASYDELQSMAKKVLETMNYNGLSSMDVIRTDQDEIVILEINPRSGAGIQFTTEAGCNTVAYLLTRDSSYLGPIQEGVYASLKQVVKI